MTTKRKQHMWGSSIRDTPCSHEGCHWRRRARFNGDDFAFWEYMWRRGPSISPWERRRRVPACGSEP